MTSDAYLLSENAPRALSLAAFERRAESRFANDPLGLKCARFLMVYDGLLVLPPRELAARLRLGLVSRDEALKHWHSNETLQAIAAENDESVFLALDYNALAREMDKRIALLKADLPPALPAAALSSLA